MITRINEYRQFHGKQPVNIDAQQNNWCQEHCWAMVRADNVYHTYPCYLQDWSEIVVVCSQEPDWGNVERHLLELIDKSEPHRNILLNANTIGYCVVAFRWKVFLTIRTK